MSSTSPSPLRNVNGPFSAPPLLDRRATLPLENIPNILRRQEKSKKHGSKKLMIDDPHHYIAFYTFGSSFHMKRLKILLSVLKCKKKAPSLPSEIMFTVYSGMGQGHI